METNKFTEKTRLVCQECGKEFRKKISIKTIEVKCPRCGGYDVDMW